MSDCRAAGSTREPAVGNQRDGGAQTHSDDGGCRVQHLAHARTALGAFIADYHHVALMNPAALDGVDCILFAVKNTRGAFVPEHFRRNGGFLDNTGVRRKIALENRDAAGLHIRIVNRTDNFGIPVDAAADVFTDILSGDRRKIQMQQSLLRKLRHNRIDAARFVQIFHVGRPCRCQVAQIRRARGNLIGDLHIDLDAGLVRDSGKMQHGIGGTAQRHIDCQGIFKGFLRENITRADVPAHQLHDLVACALGQTDSRRIDGGNGSVSGKAHADRLGQAVHGIGRIHAGAGTAGRTGVFFIDCQLLQTHRARRNGPDRLKHGGKGALHTVHFSGQHRTAGDKDRRNIEPGGSH